MTKQLKIFPVSVLVLGILCILWIIYDIAQLYIDLGDVIYFHTAGLIMGIGYLLIIIYHIFVFIVWFRYLRYSGNYTQSITIIFLIIISSFMLAVQKVMYDEVGREYYLEYPAPGEVNFIYLGLFINLIFILFTLYFINKELKIILFK